MNLAELFTRGGVWYNIPGETSADFIQTMATSIRLPAGLAGDELAQACLRREASSSTAMVRGLAFPHPGIPMAPAADAAFIAIAYPRFPVYWRAPDGQPVRAVFLIVSASRTDHLAALSGVARLCGNDAFYSALVREAPLKDLLPLMTG